MNRQFTQLKNLRLNKQAIYRKINRRRNNLALLNEFETVAYGPTATDETVLIGRREIMTGSQIKAASSNLQQGKWLAKLCCWISQRVSGPINVLEIGTAAGISGSYLLTCLSEAFGGHLLTFEGSPELADLAQKNMKTLIEENEFGSVTFKVAVGSFKHTLDEYFRTTQSILHLAFVDGNHRKEATIEYHAKVRRLMHDKGVIVYDDIAWSPGMVEAWNYIQNKEGIGRTAILCLGGRPSRGIVFLANDPAGPCEIVHLDNAFERFARGVLYKLRAVQQRRMILSRNSI